MLVNYIKLKRTTKTFTELNGEAIKAGEPIIINSSEGRYLLVGGNTDGNISSSTKVLKFLSKSNSDVVTFYSIVDAGTHEVTLKDEANNTLLLKNNSSGSAASVANALTFKNDGSGASPDQTFDGSAATKISYNSIGAPKAGASITGMDNTAGSGNVAPNNLLYIVHDTTDDWEPAATDRNKLWVDTTANTGGIKYFDSTTYTWKHVPVAYT